MPRLFMKMYAMMLSTTDDMFAEELWTRLSSIVSETDNRMFFFCGKPLNSHFGDEYYSNVIFNLLLHLPMDGLLVSAGALSTYVDLEELEDFLKRYGQVPIVSLTLPLKEHPYVGLDNYKGSYALTEHLLGHGYRRIGYLSGPMNNLEVEDRFSGFEAAVKSLDEHVEVFVEYGDYSSASGEYYGKKLLQQQVDLIVCANDQMASGVYNAAKAMGLSIPEDVAVAGFDNIEKARLMNPPLTTVQQSFSDFADSAYNLLEYGGENILLESELVIRSSCGCHEAIHSSTYESIKAGYRSAIQSYELVRSIAVTFNQVNTLKELNGELENYFEAMKATEFYLCLYKDGSQVIKKPCDFVYPDEMLMQFGYNKGIVSEYLEYQTKEGLPDTIYEKTSSRAFMIYPLGLNNISYGYIVTDAHVAMEMSFGLLRATLSNVLNRIYSYEKLNAYNKQLHEYAYRDSLTGIYNRRGLFKLVENQCQVGESGCHPAIFYCDINGLKQVNDTYGHSTGDDLIIKTAKLLEQNFSDGIVSRVGGDEFVIYIGNLTKEQADKRIHQLKIIMHSQQLDGHQQVGLGISIGYCIYDPTRHQNLSQLIDEADQHLYLVKNRD